MEFEVITEVKVKVILLHVYILIIGGYLVGYWLCVCKTENGAITIRFLDVADMKIIHLDLCQLYKR